MPKNRTENRLYDYRVVERFIRRGVVNNKDYQRFLQELPDLGNEAEAIEVTPPSAESDDAEA